ncbi:hypothetical protein [Streptomyces sp. NPDC018031]|uniref:hypothetical protein n=1 Tax=Streptomyces sp. NPDC018031 TaxID=3365033 RepID=UPI0037A8381E
MNRFDHMSNEDIQAEITRLTAEISRSGAETSDPVRQAAREAINKALDELNRRAGN